MIRSLFLVLLICLNQSFSQVSSYRSIDAYNSRRVEEMKAEGYYCDIKYVSQLPSLCVAASAQMVLYYYGQDIDQKDIKRQVDGIMYKDNDKRMFSPIFSFEKLTKGLSYFNVSWETKSYGMTKGDEGLNFIISELKNKRPVLIAAKEHVVVVNGCHENNKLLLITDPGIESPGIRIISYQELKNIWHSKNYKRFLVKT